MKSEELKLLIDEAWTKLVDAKEGLKTGDAKLMGDALSIIAEIRININAKDNYEYFINEANKASKE